MSYQQISDPCKKCGSPHIESGYGMAYGGCGVYFYCADCGEMQEKFQDSEAELPAQGAETRDTGKDEA